MSALGPSSRTWLCYGLLILGALLPLLGVLADPAGRLPGTELGDVYKHAWSYWHTPHAIGAWPWTDSLNAPGGGVLWDVMLFPSLVMSPVDGVLGPVVAANLWVFFSLFMVGVCTAGFLRAIGASELLAALGGFLAQGSPYLYGYPLYSGVHERLAVWVFPLLLWCVIRIQQGSGRRWLIWGLLGYFVAASGCGVYGVWAFLLLAMSFPFLRDKTQPWWGVRPLAPFLFGLVVIAVVLLLWMRVASGGDTLSPQPDRFGLWGINWDMTYSHASLSSLFSPGHVSAMTGDDSGDLLLELSYLGWVQFLVCLVALRSRKTRWFAGIALCFVVLSLGPFVELGGQRWTNPVYWIVAHSVPMYGSAPVPFQQLGVFATISTVGVLSLLSLDERRRWIWVVVIVVASVLERVFVLPTGLVLDTASARVSPVYGAISGGPVVELPRVYQGRCLSPGRLFLAQTQHQQGLPVSVSTGVTAWDDFHPILTGTSDNWERDLNCMRRGGFEWLVVDGENYASSAEANAQIEAIASIVGKPQRSDSRLIVFGLASLNVPLDPNRKLPPFQPMVTFDNGGQGPPVEAADRMQDACNLSGRATKICPLDLQGMRVQKR